MVVSIFKMTAARLSESRVHSPTLETILMVENTIKKSDDYLGKTQLWKALPRKVMYPTFKQILEYLEASKKIIFDKKGKIVWIMPDNPKLKRFLKQTHPFPTPQ